MKAIKKTAIEGIFIGMGLVLLILMIGIPVSVLLKWS